MTELALAAFAAETDAHVVSRPRSARFARFAAAFDEGEYRRELERHGLRFLARSDARFPPLLADHAAVDLVDDGVGHGV